MSLLKPRPTKPICETLAIANNQTLVANHQSLGASHELRCGRRRFSRVTSHWSSITKGHQKEEKAPGSSGGCKPGAGGLRTEVGPE